MSTGPRLSVPEPAVIQGSRTECYGFNSGTGSEAHPTRLVDLPSLFYDVPGPSTGLSQGLR